MHYTSSPTTNHHHITCQPARQLPQPCENASCTVVFARHPRIQDQLHNWHRAHRAWQPNHSPSCTCQQPKRRHPIHVYHDHVVIPFMHSYPSNIFFSVPAEAPSSPRKTIAEEPRTSHTLLAQTTSPPRSTRRRHHHPTVCVTTDDASPPAQTLNLHIVKSAARCIPTGIVHCENHVPNRLMKYCPTLYADAISATFLDESIFHKLITPSLTHHLNTYNNIIRLLPQYK